jgi:2Fe-2S ferredoxin
MVSVTCCVLIESDLSKLPVRNELEQEMADDRGFKNDERLACQIHVTSEMQLRVRCKMG